MRQIKNGPHEQRSGSLDQMQGSRWCIRDIIAGGGGARAHTDEGLPLLHSALGQQMHGHQVLGHVVARRRGLERVHLRHLVGPDHPRADVLRPQVRPERGLEAHQHLHEPLRCGPGLASLGQLRGFCEGAKRGWGLGADMPLAFGRGGRVFNVGEGGCQYSPLARSPPPPKGLNLRAPQNPTETDPRAPELTWTPNSAKNENGIFAISASRRFRKVIACHVFGGEKIAYFQRTKKKFAAFGATVHNKCLLVLSVEPFSRPPTPQFWGALLTPPPSPGVDNPTSPGDPGLARNQPCTLRHSVRPARLTTRPR